MTRSTSEFGARSVMSRPSWARRVSHSLSAGLAAVLGLGLALLVLRGFAQLGDNPLNLHHVLALHGPDPERDSAKAVAAESGSQLLRFGLLAGSAAAAALLLLGGWHSVAPGRSVQHGRRLLVTGLWLALAVSLVAALPLGGSVLVADLTLSVPGAGVMAVVWQPAVPEVLAVAAGLGLLLAAAASSPQPQPEPA